ncbi:MAG: hypothetical protein MSH48_05245 [Mollicutes bacterium]|nr:hypothetical protein [Mollicutes bacterium]
MKKSLFLIIIVTLIAVLTKFYISNYKIEYNVNDYDVKTIYKNKRFYFEIKKDKIFNFDIYSKRKLSKTKVYKIEELDLANYYCIIPFIKDMKTYPLCYSKETQEYIDYNLINDELLADYQYKSNLNSKPEKDFEYYNLLKENEYIALWTYKGYIIMNGKSFKNVNIFKKDRYDNSLSYIIDNTIYMPNYDEEHEYSKMIKLNLETHKIDSISLEKKIDFDSYIVGNIKNKLYIFDNKNSILYELNLKNSKLSVIGNTEKGFIKYKDGKWLICSKTEYKINKIKIDNHKDSNYTYKIKNGLFKQIKENNNITTKISDNISNIIYEYNDDIYYIYEDNLYLYNSLKGNNKVFYNYELNFNKDNTIFMYIK